MIGDVSDKLAGRLGKLIPRLASEHDHEIVATVRAIQSALRADGLDLHDLAASLSGARMAKATIAAQISPAPTWRTMSHHESQEWMRLILASPETSALQRQRLEDFANRLRLGMRFAPPWQRVRLFDELVARLHAKGARL